MSDLLPVVALVGGTPRVSSLDIAEKFDKRHERVLDAIRRTASQLPSGFTQHNFVSSEYTDGTGRKLPCYSLTRDAFSLVAMGFTGKAALAWKVRYIEAFNAMEAALHSPKPLSLAPFLPSPRCLSPASRRRLVTLVDAKITDVPAHHVWRARMRLWTALNRRFGVLQYRQLPEDRLADAIAFLSAMEVGPRGKVILKDQQALPARPAEDIKRTASALAALIEQARDVLASLPASEAQEVM